MAYKPDLNSLELTLACAYIRGEWNLSAKACYRSDKPRHLKRLRIMAACALLAELNLFEREREQGMMVSNQFTVLQRTLGIVVKKSESSKRPRVNLKVKPRRISREVELISVVAFIQIFG